MPKVENVRPYFVGHNDSSFFSVFRVEEKRIDTKTNAIINDTKIVAVMTSRPLHVTMKTASFDVYYVDYLCVDTSRRNQGIAPQIIQTHHYNQRVLNKKIAVSLFKREGDLTAIVPLCTYTTHGFSMVTWVRPPRLANTVSIVEVGRENAHHLADFLKLNRSQFDIVILPETSNLLELIKTQNIYCFVAISANEVKSAYFFRRTCTTVAVGQEMVSCFASINAFEGAEPFINAFKVSAWRIRKKHTSFRYMLIEDVSHNSVLIENISKRTEPSLVSPTAYFFYNFAWPTFRSSKCLIIH
jgi:hypothetical protein